MKKMNKGFTLIELMVVIVIIGILAAVAITKFSGTTASAKASEIPNASGNYETQQQAYFQRTDSVGTGAQIGFDSPKAKGTVYFTWDHATKGILKATSAVALNDCAAGGTWITTIAANGTNTGLTATRAVSTTQCEALTAGWKHTAKTI